LHRPIVSALAEPDPDVPPLRPASRPRVAQHLRSTGAVDLSLHRHGGRLAVGRSAQSGCLRARFPRRSGADEAPCAVLINTAGGIADGDRLQQRIVWDENAFACVATQAAEKVYRSLDSGSEIETRLEVGEGARAEWMPQETILFDGCRLRRDTQVRLAGSSDFLGVEAIVLGRHAMGEFVRHGSLRDSMRIWRDGRLIYADRLLLDGRVSALMGEAAIGQGAVAMAVIIHASAAVAELLAPIRSALQSAEGRAAASTWNGLLVVRLLAPTGEQLRQDITTVLGVLCEGRPLPRVWRC
jgi:urease accessory protein